MKEFGNTFKSAREERGTTIEEIAQETRISTRFLRAIEEEAFDELPGGVFNRGFIRSYASQVGLDPDVMIEAYASLTADAPAAEAIHSRAPNSGGDRHVVPIAVGGLIALAFVLVVVSQREPSEPPNLPPTPATSAAIAPDRTRVSGDMRAIRPNEPADSHMTEPPPAALDALAGDAATTDDATAETAEATGEAAAADIPVEAEAEAREARPEAEVTEGTPVVPVRTTAESAPPENSQGPESEDGEAVEDATSSFDVRLEVRERTQVYVELDGNVMYEYVMINPPFWRTYTVNEALELRIADPSAVSLNIDGEPVEDLGPPDQAWSGTITHDSVALLTGRQR